MFKLCKQGDNNYVLIANDSAISGNTFRITYVMRELGFNFDDIEKGLISLIDDNIAEFGINKTFIYSKKV